VLLGGDDGGDAAPDATEDVVQTAGGPTGDTEGDEEVTPVTAASQTVGQQSGRDCSAATGRCVFITDVALDGETVVARYETVGYEPHQNAGPDSHHVHFYFDTVPVTQAGVPADPQNWVAWGLEEGSGEFVYTFPTSNIPAEATQLCASVANVEHGLDGLEFQCVPLPRA
jgi:hypothetical protein